MAKQRSIACTKCDRKFSMPAHLARHMTTIHGTASASKGKQPGQLRQFATAAGAMIGDTVHEAVSSLRTLRDRIIRDRDRLTGQLETLGRALADFGHGSDSSSAAKTAKSVKSASRSGPKAKRGTVTLAMLKTLAQYGPIMPTDLAHRAGAKPTTVSTALDNFRKKSLVVRGDRGWSLTSAGRSELSRRERGA